MIERLVKWMSDEKGIEWGYVLWIRLKYGCGRRCGRCEKRMWVGKGGSWSERRKRVVGLCEECWIDWYSRGIEMDEEVWMEELRWIEF